LAKWRERGSGIEKKRQLAAKCKEKWQMSRFTKKKKKGNVMGNVNDVSMSKK